MDKLESAELDDLPIVIKFLLQTVEPDTVGDVIETLRQNLDFKSISRLQRSSKSKTKVVSQTPEVLILGNTQDYILKGCKCGSLLTDRHFSTLSKHRRAQNWNPVSKICDRRMVQGAGRYPQAGSCLLLAIDQYEMAFFYANSHFYWCDPSIEPPQSY